MKAQNINRKASRKIRHDRIKRKLNLFQNTLPRLVVCKSNKHLIAQIVDDQKGLTLAYVTSKKQKANANVTIATALGEEIAALALAKKITNVVFDRGGSPFHGQIKALAEGARKGGLKF